MRIRRIPLACKQAQASKLRLLKYSKDTKIHKIYKSKLEAENSRLADSNRYVPCIELECAEASVPDPTALVGGNTRSGLGFTSQTMTRKAVVSNYIHDVDVSQQLKHLEKL